MTQYGQETSFYIQKELIKLIDDTVAKFPEKFKSRSHVICAAVSKFLRENIPKEFQNIQNSTPGSQYFETR